MKLNRKVAIYVPSTVNGNSPAPVETVKKWVARAKTKFALLFGGFTAFVANGGWYSSQNGLIEEQIVVVQSYTDDNGMGKMPEVLALAKEIAADMSQECVSVEHDGALTFVNA